MLGAPFFLFSSPFFLGLFWNPHPIIDSEKCVCTVYGGIPDTPNFMRDIHDPVVEAMEIAWAQASLSESRLYHCHGNWASPTTGATHRTGRNEPGNFVDVIINTAVILALVSNTAFINLAEFASGVFLLLLFEPMLIPSILTT
jgi:hypothetical protein